MDFGGIQGGIVDRIASNMDEEQVQEAVLQIIEEKAHPHLEDIKQRAENTEDADYVREYLESLEPEERNKVFHEAWGELIATFVQTRIEPMDGIENLKRMVRDPWTVESLLLIMEDEEIPADVEQEQKDALATYLHWMGIAIAPEMYELEDVEEMVAEFGADDELLDKYREANDDE